VDVPADPQSAMRSRSESLIPSGNCRRDDQRQDRPAPTASCRRPARPRRRPAPSTISLTSIRQSKNLYAGLRLLCELRLHVGHQRAEPRISTTSSLAASTIRSAMAGPMRQRFLSPS